MGDSVVTTLNLELQEAAYDALGNYKGAVVVMEPSTGKILAMVSKPDFDPNTVAENWDFLNTDQDSVLLNRATQGQYAPGSTFKVVTALEYMRENPDYENYGYNCTGAIEKDGVTIRCYNGHVHGQVGFQDSLAYSCNTSFPTSVCHWTLRILERHPKNCCLIPNFLPCCLTVRVPSRWSRGLEALIR